MSADPEINLVAPPQTCSVLGIAIAQRRLWLASDAGLWQFAQDTWVACPAPAALDFVAMLATAGVPDAGDGVLIAAGLPAGIAYSLDGGQRWLPAATDLIASSVTCMVASPQFAHDRVLLAGTEQDGMLRSTDGGRRWQLANFGLTEFTILALAVTPTWEVREEALVATDGGLYRSPNGGRAWKRSDVGLAGCMVQALMVSPAYAIDHTIYAGVEDGPLFASINQGRSWAVLPAAPEQVNSLWAHPDHAGICLAGTSDGQILRSRDAGQTWVLVHPGHDAVLTFAASQGTLFAGCYGGGLLASSDDGASWQQLLA